MKYLENLKDFHKKRACWVSVFAGCFLLSSFPSFAATKNLSLDGSQLSVFWLIPFIGLLLSLALLPAVKPLLWHHHFGKITFTWVLVVLAPLVMFQGHQSTFTLMLEILLHEYLPFILMIGTFYILSGNLHIDVYIPGKPFYNTAFLMVGSLLSNLIGTTGAAMLFIHPLLRMNHERAYKTHTLVFFIFMVCNVGGSLSPVGDPPLFIGFLNGVPFLWPLLNLLKPFLMVWLPLCVFYFCLDHFHFYPKEAVDIQHKLQKRHPRKIFKVSGKEQLFFFAGAIGAILISGFWDPQIQFEIAEVPFLLQNLCRDGLLILLMMLSLFFGDPKNRKLNGFSWIPLEEVGILFIGIFITAAPVISILQAGSSGCLENIFSWMMPGGVPSNFQFFWVTAFLSAFLDNAPTYLSFFYVAGGDAKILTSSLNTTLIAIATGAVFMGAVTYIGNAPNLMIRTIAEKKGIPMPHFFGYIGWSMVFLIPLYLLISLILFL